MLFLIILLLSIVAGFILPWWFIAVIAFAAAIMLGKKPGYSFWMGFLAVMVAWALLALIKTLPNDNMLASRVATLVHLPNWFFLLLISAIIGGLVGGMAALSGALIRDIFKKSEKA
jgi:MFS family permease